MNDKLIEQIKTAHNNPKTPTGRYRNSDLISLVEEIETLRAAVSSLTTHEADDAIGWECRECKKFNLSHRAQCRNCKTASPLM